MDASDQAAIARVQAGEKDAFRLLVERYSAGVFHLAYRMTGRAEDAEEVVQESFLRAFRQIHSLRSAGRLRHLAPSDRMQLFARSDSETAAERLPGRGRRGRSEGGPGAGAERGSGRGPGRFLGRAQIENRLDRRVWRQWHWPRPLAWAAVVAALVLAFLAGRWMVPVEEPAVATAPADVRDRVLLVALGDHLERSQILLVELKNTEANGAVDISVERASAEELVGPNRLYRQTAAASGEPAIVDLLDDLERVLLEVAHGPDRMGAGEVNELRGRIESQGILFRVRVLESRIGDSRVGAAEKTIGVESEL